MKAILLAGGFGTRLSEYTEAIPKPMVTVGGRPILWHIMRTYAHFGHKDFYVALGYKAELIKEYFLHYRSLNADFTVDLATGAVSPHQIDDADWRVTLVHTGLESMTGGRVKRMQSFIGNEPFMLTYGDGVADIDINALLKFHRSHGKMVTVTAVHPGARFGELLIENEKVASFQEKPQMGQGWINGGYFVIQPEFFDLITDDTTILERQPLEQAARMGELMAYRHDGFWHCMDTKRDRDELEELWQSGDAVWRV
ncbi:glucose-1-phosphate cytidylyltransferase [Sulfuritalea hydrogenivorans]|uniref:Glucose-1-phosphate cytidylyltransferase n=1 Tax=Sulfuritalea hydrogenivorans sk43H TaxID=1223802 RepID=W0SJZ2_9PROT|nr:glucose-1-phosphate cytidylyltransferase [Sulfuritalea hydrogenivorans]BAO31121.1 glucose-1-phosphate cytidylyltransferase [Sulfuritalea hydrogenivorans sk43H]